MITLPSEVKKFIQTIREVGFECYAVGGSVRDTILGRPTHGWDFTTSATPQEIQKILPDSYYNNNFGTVGVKVADDIFEITTYRREGKYSDVRHPDEISWAKTIEEDLARRDFAMNAIATDGEKIVDPYNGQKDIAAKIIRCVGNPGDRFAEDGLRLMRAIRFASQLGFTIEEATWQAITKNLGLITKVSSERVRDELIKILASDFPADGVKLLHTAGLLDHILPELTKAVGVDQKGTHHVDDVFTHSLKALAACPNPNWVVRLAVLLHDVGKPVTYKEVAGRATFHGHEVVGARVARNIADRLHFSKEDREKLYMLVRWHMFSVSEFLTDAAIRRFIRRVGPDNTTDMLDLRTADRLGSGTPKTSWRHEQFRQRIIEVQKHIPSVNDLKVDGHDVMKVLGIAPGPRVGIILSKLFAEISEDPAKNDREHLLKQIKAVK
ncbi:MAG: CCA tRNA nucleotidyltransferase [Patescibacteria group bacterium]|nr:CCA tRNA nucleotidyltransferase [Patescibacteria group bacterium]MCL5431478.1 CCA tRNA nucleotidyltransferase [Patescibacteria group bacterium]